MRVRFPPSAHNYFLFEEVATPKFTPESLEYLQELDYCFDNGPMVSSLDEVDTKGINCQLLIHIVLEELGLTVPKWLRSKELFEPSDFMIPVFTGNIPVPKLRKFSFAKVRIGDIFFFAGKKYHESGGDNRFLHVAICVEMSSEHGPILMHISKYSGNVIESVPLNQFAQKCKNYTALLGIRRVQSKNVMLSERDETEWYSRFEPTSATKSQ